MLDQNTDRMWYVIGAIVIGAAIIAMGLNIFSESFDSVDGMMSSLTGIANEKVFSISGGIYTEEEIDNLVNNEDYIPVATAEELDNIRKGETLTYGAGSKWESEYTSGLDKKFIQVANIDLSGIKNWMPIGGLGYSFTGSFDGGGYVINGLYVDSNDYSGFIGYADSGEFSNIILDKVSVEGDRYTGGLVAYQINSSIVNSQVSGVIKGSLNVGGLVGSQDDSTVVNCQTNGEVYNSGWNSGGLIGRQDESSLSNSHSNVDVEGSYDVGGLVGVQHRDSNISNSFARGVVIGNTYVGGLVGWQYEDSTIRNSYAIPTVTGKDRVGGLVGYQSINSSILNSYVGVGDVNGTGRFGIFVGDHGLGCSIVDSGWDSNSTLDSGFGDSNGSISNTRGYTTSEINDIINNLF